MAEEFDKKVVSELKPIVKKLNKLNKIEYDNLVSEVEGIISFSIKDEQIIEHTLDRILNLLFFDENKIDSLFFRLLNYYDTLNKEASNAYRMIYMDDYLEQQREIIKENDDGYRLTLGKDENK